MHNSPIVLHLIAEYKNKSFKFYPGDEWPVNFDVTFRRSNHWLLIGSLEGNLLIYGKYSCVAYEL